MMVKKIVPKQFGWFEVKETSPRGAKLWIDDASYMFLTNGQIEYINNQLQFVKDVRQISLKKKLKKVL